MANLRDGLEGVACFERIGQLLKFVNGLLDVLEDVGEISCLENIVLDLSLERDEELVEVEIDNTLYLFLALLDFLDTLFEDILGTKKILDLAALDLSVQFVDARLDLLGAVIFDILQRVDGVIFHYILGEDLRNAFRAQWFQFVH